MEDDRLPSNLARTSESGALVPAGCKLPLASRRPACVTLRVSPTSLKQVCKLNSTNGPREALPGWCRPTDPSAGRGHGRTLRRPGQCLPATLSCTHTSIALAQLGRLGSPSVCPRDRPSVRPALPRKCCIGHPCVALASR